MLKELFESKVGMRAIVHVDQDNRLSGVVIKAYEEYVVLNVGEFRHFVAYSQIFRVEFQEETG